MFVFVMMCSGLLAVCRSVFAVPYGALGMELTPNYDERTRVIAWKNFVGIIGTFCAAWFYWFTQRSIWGNEITGVRILSFIGAAFVLVAAALTVTRCKERQQHSTRQPRVPMLKAIGTSFRNRPFLMVLGAQMLLAFGTGVVGILGSYVHIMYACAGNKDLASMIGGLGGTLTVISNLIAIPLGLWVSTHYGKRRAALVGLGILFFGLAILPFTLRPVPPEFIAPFWESSWAAIADAYVWAGGVFGFGAEHFAPPPYATMVVVTWFIDAIGMPCAAMIFGSMLPDICDDDELNTGMRREGTYSAVNSFVGRVVGIVTLLASGILPKLAGYTNPALDPTAPMLERMRYMLIAIQIAVVVVAVIVVSFYPITRQRAAETQRLIAARRQGAA